MVTASIVLGVPSSANHGEPDLYRLTLTCRAGAHDGEMQLAWSPNVPGSGQTMSAVVDGGPAVAYKVEGTEKMGNGSSGTSGPGSTILNALATARADVDDQQSLPGSDRRVSVRNAAGGHAPAARGLLRAAIEDRTQPT